MSINLLLDNRNKKKRNNYRVASIYQEIIKVKLIV